MWPLIETLPIELFENGSITVATIPITLSALVRITSFLASFFAKGLVTIILIVVKTIKSNNCTQISAFNKAATKAIIDPTVAHTITKSSVDTSIIIEIITNAAHTINDKLYVEAFERMWSRFSLLFPVKHQYDDINNPNLYMDLLGVQIYDTARNGFTNVYRLIRNISNKWCDVNLSNGRRLLCTADHPFETNNRGVVFAEKLQDVATVEKAPKLEGRNMSMFLTEKR